MPPPSYAHRHLLLAQLLDGQPEPPPSAFAVAGAAAAPAWGAADERGRQLDALLLAGWAKGKGVDRDVVSHAENLRLRTADYDVLGRLGEGQFGVVDAVRSKLDGKVYAMKTVQKTMALRAGDLGLRYERHLHRLAGAGSPVPALSAAFQSPDALHLVIAYAPCGSLWDRMTDGGTGADGGAGEVVPMAEDEVAWWGAQMVGAIAHVHALGFAHRDIKPHNFLLVPPARALLTDFGSAAPLTSTRVPLALCALPAGTPDYVSPEVLAYAEAALVAASASVGDDGDSDSPDALGYGCETDYWSAGVCLCEMASGKTPFWAERIARTYERIVRCDVRVPDASAPLRSLLSSPADARLGRGGPREVLSHAFLAPLADVDFTRPPPAALGVRPPAPIDLATLAPAFDDVSYGSGSLGSLGGHILNGMDEMTFDHFFASSPGLSSTTLASLRDSVRSRGDDDEAGEPPARWVGWTVIPPADQFGAAPPAPAPSPVRVSAPHAWPGPARSPTTPARPTHAPASAPRTAPRSVSRTRPMSEGRAYAELLACVRASARKTIRERGATPAGAVARAGPREPREPREPRAAGSGGAAHDGRRAPDLRRAAHGEPPTPTPGSREPSRLVGLDLARGVPRVSRGAAGAENRESCSGNSAVQTRAAASADDKRHADLAAADTQPDGLDGLDSLERWNAAREREYDVLQGRLESIRRRLADAL